MARYDKYNGMVGGFRAPLLANTIQADVGNVRAVSLDNTGKVVIGTAGQSGFVGVIVADSLKNAGDIIDVMTAGEIVDMASLAAGTKYYAAANGTLTATGPGAGVNAGFVGVTVEATRLVVRASMVQG